MALKKNYIFADVIITDAFIRITDVNIHHNPELALELDPLTTSKHICNRVTLEIKSAKNKKKVDIWSSETFNFVVDLKKDVIKQAYDHLKKLSDKEVENGTSLSTAVDVND